MPFTDARPISRPLVGAAFAACVTTSLPGLTLVFANSGLSGPDLRALSAELIVGAIAATFGALQIKAQTRSSGKWIGLAPLSAMAVAVFVIGMGFIFEVGSGSVDSGPFIILGGIGVLAVVAAQIALAAFAWFLLSVFVSDLDRAAASGIDPNISISKWLGIAAIVHMLLKCTTGGPALFGLFAAVLAVSHGLRSKQTLGLVLGALSIAAAVSTTLGVRVYYAHKNRLESLPQCESDGVIASHVRAMSGVADVLVFSPPPYETADVTVVVLPVGGGSVPQPMRDAIVRDAMSSGCVVDTAGTRPIVTVQDPKYVEIPMTVRAHLFPGANADEARKSLIAVTRQYYEPRANVSLLRDPQTAGNETPTTPQDAGVQIADWMIGSEDLGRRVDELPIGSAVTPGKIEVEFVTDQ